MTKPPRIKSKIPNTGAIVKLPDALIQAWREVVLKVGRSPRGGKYETQDQRFHAILKSETEDVKELWEIFTGDRDRIGRYLMNPDRQTAAYLLGFHLVNAARVWHGLTESNRRHNWLEGVKASGRSIRILDLGCGTGAMAQAIQAFLGPVETTIELVDKSRAFLSAAELGLKALNPDSKVHALRLGVEQFEDRHRDKRPADETTIIALGYLWNELERSPRARTKLLETIKSYGSRPTLVTVVEPANEHLARSTMELRDAMVSMGFQPLYPCPHTLSCPMLERSRDWCYSELKWNRPTEAINLDKLTGLDRSLCHGGIYVFATPNLKVADGAPGKSVIVGRPLAKGTKGEKFSYLVCQQDGTLSKEKPTGDVTMARGSFCQ